MSELFDHVDETNTIIGTTTKAEAHRRGLPHRIAAVFVFNQDGELLVNQRADNLLLDHSVGGHLRHGEDKDAAAAREAWEEIGLPLATPLQFLGTLFVDESGREPIVKHWFNLYETRTRKFNPHIDSSEVLAATWWSLGRLEKEMRASPLKFTAGFIGTTNFYLQRHDPNHLPIPFFVS